MKFRAFISADIAPDERLLALLEGLRRSGADLKVVRPANLHVTLKFLGDTDEHLVPEIAGKMGEAVADLRPFPVVLRGMGAFPSLSNVKVVWVGMDDGKALEGIAGKLEDSLEGMGIRRDRRGFKPHLTVARARSARGIAPVQEFIAANAATEFGAFQVDRLILKKSVLTPKGPEYSNVQEVPFGV